jgi:hypothetical protein
MPKKQTRKLTQNLQYKFAPDELLTLGRELGESQIALRQLDDDRKRVADEWKSKISTSEAHINNLSNKVSTGYEYRDVDCEMTYDDPKSGQKTIRRLDSGEIVKVMRMDPNEMQEELPIDEEET